MAPPTGSIPSDPPEDDDATRPATGPIDRFGRVHRSLRISVTDRCNIRCRYCMPERVSFRPQSELLSFEEITRFARVAVGMGITKIRLTGGEPLLRRELPKLVAMLSAIDGIEDLALTTNAVLLADHAADLKRAGLRRVNVSLDTLDREAFRRLTRRDELPRVLAGIEAADRVGLRPIKINAVAMKGITPVVDLARFCRERDFGLRLIEFMPLEADRIWEPDAVLSADEILRRLDRAGLPVDPVGRRDPAAPAEEYAYRDRRGRIGVVASVTRPFCGACDRIRITAEGMLRNCLFALEEIDLREAIRSGDSDAEIARLIRESVDQKWEGHHIGRLHFVQPARPMHEIGG